MAQPAPTYDLVMLLDPQAQDEARARPLAEARAAIEAQGELLRHAEWGNRTLAYAIDRREAAEYHLLQFHAGTPELLRTLDRSLRIADEVLRFRIVKLKPGVPETSDAPAAIAPSRHAAPEPAAQEPAAQEPAAEAPAASPGPAADGAGESQAAPGAAEASSDTTS
jgi:small subunit ribosomal protein S6